MDSQKIRKIPNSSFPWKREPNVFNWLSLAWIPACAGMTSF